MSLIINDIVWTLVDSLIATSNPACSKTDKCLKGRRSEAVRSARPLFEQVLCLRVRDRWLLPPLLSLSAGFTWMGRFIWKTQEATGDTRSV